MNERKHEQMESDGICPRCGGIADRDEVDVGVGIVAGPWGCTEGCGWSESTDYDTEFDGGLQNDGSYLDPQGGLYPAASPIARALTARKGGSDDC